MKLCITSTGKDIEANIDTRFGRAPYFLIIDTETNAIEVVENSAFAQGQGAGISAATLVLDKGIDGILTGRVGPNALKVFEESGVQLFEGLSTGDTVREALVRFSKGEYTNTQIAQQTLSSGQGGGRGLEQGKGFGGQGRGMGGGRGNR